MARPSQIILIQPYNIKKADIMRQNINEDMKRIRCFEVHGSLFRDTGIAVVADCIFRRQDDLHQIFCLIYIAVKKTTDQDIQNTSIGTVQEIPADLISTGCKILQSEVHPLRVGIFEQLINVSK